MSLSSGSLGSKTLAEEMSILPHEVTNQIHSSDPPDASIPPYNTPATCAGHSFSSAHLGSQMAL
eukprot:scaffold2835_cov259-Pinguiococcus_pyrenoidosus.AAC.2